MLSFLTFCTNVNCLNFPDTLNVNNSYYLMIFNCNTSSIFFYPDNWDDTQAELQLLARVYGLDVVKANKVDFNSCLK